MWNICTTKKGKSQWTVEKTNICCLVKRVVPDGPDPIVFFIRSSLESAQTMNKTNSTKELPVIIVSPVFATRQALFKTIISFPLQDCWKTFTPLGKSLFVPFNYVSYVLTYLESMKSQNFDIKCSLIYTKHCFIITFDD